MKITVTGLCVALSIAAYGQTITTKSYPVQPGQQLRFKFEYPVVHISTWAKKEVSITAKVNINNDENDSAFSLEEETTHGTILIRDRIKDFDQLPRKYTVVRNGLKTVYKNKGQYIEAKKRGGIGQCYDGVDLDIHLEIKVPEGSTTDIKAVYGIVELSDFHAPLTVDAPYGGIDATINKNLTGKLQATTSYGQIYSNLDLKLTDHTERDFFNSITAEPGKGPAYEFTSTYGKIYLRKPSSNKL